MGIQCLFADADG